MADRNEPIVVPGTNIKLYRKPKGVLFSGRPTSVNVGDHCMPDVILVPWAGQVTKNKDQIPSGLGEGWWEQWMRAGYDNETGEELYVKTGLISYRQGHSACVSFTEDIPDLFVFAGKTMPAS